mmetsp:Transcript_93747/g.301769  ORF Transcript_93747/g.301769 Transcript_93747/m.301769 type:complete len:116 (+) Transcript_93747:1380-1727(+)
MKDSAVSSVAYRKMGLGGGTPDCAAATRGPAAATAESSQPEKPDCRRKRLLRPVEWPDDDDDTAAGDGNHLASSQSSAMAPEEEGTCLSATQPRRNAFSDLNAPGARDPSPPASR